MMATSPLVTTQVYKVKCNRCHKNKTVHIRSDYANFKDMEYIDCICGNKISVGLLSFQFRDREFVEERLKYFISNQ